MVLLVKTVFEGEKTVTIGVRSSLTQCHNMPRLMKALVAVLSITAAYTSSLPSLARRDDLGRLESAKKACALLNDALPGLVAFPGE